jgi:probable HAF family extracellular repeat protein
MTDLGTLGGSYSVARGINPSGVVVGYSETTEGQQHAFLWSKGVMTDLGTLDGSYSIAWGINPRGEIVGESGQHATLWTRN